MFELTLRSRSSPPTENAITPSLSLNLLVTSQPANTVFHPLVVGAGRQFGTLSVGAYASNPHNVR